MAPLVYNDTSIARPRTLGMLRMPIERGELLPHEVDARDVGYSRMKYDCISRAGRPRLFHEFDRDGICCWCDQHDVAAELSIAAANAIEAMCG